MKTPRLAAALAGVALTGFVLACERGSAPSGPAASKADRIAPSFSTASSSEQKFRWDIVSLVAGSVGIASAKANDNSKITLTGSGTFETNDKDEVTGGGTWETFSSNGTSTGSGSYTVTGLVGFELAPGTLGGDTRAGLAILRIAYSDGSQGILVASCHLPGTPADVFEGVTASKGNVDFWNRIAPMAGVNENRTLFHALEEDD